MRSRIGLRFVPWLLLAVACAPATADESVPLPPAFDVEILVVDERGKPIPEAVYVVPEDLHAADRDGELTLRIHQPLAGVVTAPGYLDEPLVVSRQTPRLAVRMFERIGPDGAVRTAMHLGGDVMLGRRYLEPTRDDTALLRSESIAADARAVVSDLAPIFASADVSMVNLESVVGDLPLDQAYPGKRFLLQTPSEALAALDELGVDVVTLGNNHINDWQRSGLDSTLTALDKAGFLHVGAGHDGDAARKPAFVSSEGQTIAVLSYTTVNGDFVNDNMPTSADTPPVAIPQQDEWLWETKTFDWRTDDLTVFVEGELTAGDAWVEWRLNAPLLSGKEQRALWAAMSETFPELQDWVARRGHGGAAWFRPDAVDEDVAVAREAGADLVVVQLHGGFQFAEVGSEYLQKVARRSIDAGADVVIGHHPHVLQGFEWYNGKLIAYSLGNLVFDQDFLATYPGAVLRLVHEGDRLIEAKVIPTSLEGYRPVPAADDVASSILRSLDARSAVPAVSERQGDGSVAKVVVGAESKSPARVTAVGNAGYLGHATTAIETTSVTVPAIGSAILDTDRLVVPRSDLSDVWFGRDIFGRGSFDDAFADGVAAGGAEWTWGHSGRLVARGDGLALELATRPGNTRNALARSVARITRNDADFIGGNGVLFADDTFYTVRLDVRRTTDVTPQIRVKVYHFDDSDPVRDPVNEVIREVVVPVDVPTDGQWHTTEVKLPVETFLWDGARSANAAFVYLQVPPGRGVVTFDNIQVLEFRPASDMPGTLLQVVDAIRSTDGVQTVVLSLS